MPIDEPEFHPFLGDALFEGSKRMIVGTFPVYSLTAPRSASKQAIAHKRGDIDFYYGSRSSSWWKWYKTYVDSSINDTSREDIISSLRKNKISVSDVISSCSRNDISFEDKDLINKKWNHDMISFIDKGINKILCTSKSENGAMGWLKNRILKKAGFHIDAAKTLEFHERILSRLPKSVIDIRPIGNVFNKNGIPVYILALPSPGSPYRRLVDFGLQSGTHESKQYLQNYLKVSFDWFLDSDDV